MALTSFVKAMKTLAVDTSLHRCCRRQMVLLSKRPSKTSKMSKTVEDVQDVQDRRRRPRCPSPSKTSNSKISKRRLEDRKIVQGPTTFKT
ncbi:hypothetical protein CLOM_g5875 [Closterium sp. NIES-68]|nr:hypothetical protein CLOM_g5875 [Closterium sp. NIES-68]GJP76472.1 hypothetical protein CLOP_g6915 [Closterium sp. NIES-67]